MTICGLATIAWPRWGLLSDTMFAIWKLGFMNRPDSDFGTLDARCSLSTRYITAAILGKHFCRDSPGLGKYA